MLFYVRFFRLVWNTNLLCPIDSGAINAEADGDAIKVTYRLRTVRLCIMTTGMALAAVVFTLSANLDVMKAGGIGLLAWLWLFGGNYLIALGAIPLVREGVRARGLAGPIRAPRGVTVTS